MPVLLKFLQSFLVLSNLSFKFLIFAMRFLKLFFQQLILVAQILDMLKHFIVGLVLGEIDQSLVDGILYDDD